MTVLTYFYQNCPVCGRSMRVQVRWLGQRVRCRHCHATTRAYGDTVHESDNEACHARTVNRTIAKDKVRIGNRDMDSDLQHSYDAEEAELAERAILLVEDDREFLESMSRYLTRKGYCVTPVHHPRMALQAISIQPHRIAVLDRRLPEFDGAQLMQMLRRYVDGLHVIFLSGHADAADRRSLLAAGAFDYLTKPCPMTVLEESVCRALESASMEKVTSQAAAEIS